MIKLFFLVPLIFSSICFGQILQVNPDDISFKYVQVKSLGIHSGYNIQVYAGKDLVYTRPYLNFATLEQVKAFVDENALTTIGLAKQNGKKIKLDVSAAKSMNGFYTPEKAFEALFKTSNQASENKRCDESIANRIAFVLGKKSTDSSKLSEISAIVSPSSDAIPTSNANGAN